MLGVTSTTRPSSARRDIARPVLDTAARVGSAVPASAPASSRAENPSDGIAGVMARDQVGEDEPLDAAVTSGHA
jgi:hypothetical protein